MDKELVLGLVGAVGIAASAQANIISSPNSQALYGNVYPLIEETYPDLNVMIVTRDFIEGAAEAYEKHDDFAALSIYGGCGQSPVWTREAAEIYEDKVKLYQAMADRFFEYATGEQVFVPEDQIMAGMRSDHTAIETFITSATDDGAGGIGSAITLNHYFPEMTGTVGILTMPHEAINPIAQSKLFSGIPEQFLNINANSQDHVVHLLGHEITHLINRDGSGDNPEQIYYCIDIVPSLADATVAFEAEADIGAAEFMKKAEAAGLMSGADVITEIAHLRGVGALLKAGNGYVASDSSSLDTHLTTSGFDPSQPDFREQFNYAALDGISTLPMLINNYADVLAGFAVVDKKKIDVAANPDKYLEDDILFYEGLPIDAALVTGNSLGSLGWVGQQMRRFEDQPQYHYAAVRYLKENGHFDAIKEGLRPEYADAMDDLVDDYLKGMHYVSTNIVNGIDYQKFSERVSGIDIGEIELDLSFWIQQYRNSPEIGDGLEKSLSQSMPEYMFQ